MVLVPVAGHALIDPETGGAGRSSFFPFVIVFPRRHQDGADHETDHRPDDGPEEQKA